MPQARLAKIFLPLALRSILAGIVSPMAEMGHGSRHRAA
jgi:hypothetical protein